MIALNARNRDIGRGIAVKGIIIINQVVLVVTEGEITVQEGPGIIGIVSSSF
jgi:hypothetical protein